MKPHIDNTNTTLEWQTDNPDFNPYIYPYIGYRFILRMLLPAALLRDFFFNVQESKLQSFSKSIWSEIGG